MVKFGIVVNPRSRYLRHNPGATNTLRRLVGDRGVVAESRNIEDVPAIARSFRAQDVDVLGIVGGDGTAGITAKAFLEVYNDRPMPPLAMLRGGTMNTVANSLGLSRGRPEKRLKQLLAASSNGRTLRVVHRRTLAANGRIGFLFGTGVFRHFLTAYYEAGGDDPSARTAVETIARAAASAMIRGPFVKRITAPIMAQVEVDGDLWPARPYMALNAGTVAEVGLGFKVFHLCEQGSVGFHFLSMHGDAAQIVRDMPRVWRGRGMRPVNGRNILAQRVVIRTDSGRVPHMVDGDLYTSEGPLEVTVGPTLPIVAG